MAKKVVTKRTTVRFKTKTGEAVSFKALKTVERKSRRRNVPTSPAAGIRAGLEDLKAGRIHGPFKTAKELLESLHRPRRRRRAG